MIGVISSLFWYGPISSTATFHHGGNVMGRLEWCGNSSPYLVCPFAFPTSRNYFFNAVSLFLAMVVHFPLMFSSCLLLDVPQTGHRGVFQICAFSTSHPTPLLKFSSSDAILLNSSVGKHNHSLISSFLIFFRLFFSFSPGQRIGAEHSSFPSR